MAPQRPGPNKPTNPNRTSCSCASAGQRPRIVSFQALVRLPVDPQNPNQPLGQYYQHIVALILRIVHAVLNGGGSVGHGSGHGCGSLPPQHIPQGVVTVYIPYVIPYNGMIRQSNNGGAPSPNSHLDLNSPPNDADNNNNSNNNEVSSSSSTTHQANQENGGRAGVSVGTGLDGNVRADETDTDIDLDLKL